jgi:DNA (cytosine-5)-methyltransferase 1
VAQPRARRANGGGGGDEHEPEFVGDPVPAAEARANWPTRYSRGAAARRYLSLLSISKQR